MPPKRNVIIGHVGGAQPTHRSLRKASTDVIIGHAKPLGQQRSSTSQRKGGNKDIIIQAVTEQPWQVDLIEEADGQDDQLQAKVCTFIAQYLICDLTIFRHLWANGSNIVTDISTCYQRCKGSPGILPAPCAPTQWRSNVMTALGPTTFAGLAVLMHISGPHIIGHSAGPEIILCLHLSMN